MIRKAHNTIEFTYQQIKTFTYININLSRLQLRLWGVFLFTKLQKLFQIIQIFSNI